MNLLPFLITAGTWNLEGDCTHSARILGCKFCNPSEQESQPNGFDGEKTVQELQTRLRDSGFDLNAQLDKPSRKTPERKGENSIEEENTIEDPIDSFIKIDED